jgi:uncharacterized protein
VPELVATDLAFGLGPALSEQADYCVYVRAKGGARLSLVHRDPVLCRDIVKEDNDSVLHGNVNFGSDIGLSDFELRCDGRTEARFTVEVFPTKVDYRSDYQDLLADVQEHLLALALEYLRPTHQEGAATRPHGSTDLEWALVLRHLIGELERAVAFINRRPNHGLRRERRATPVAKVSHVTSEVRAALRRGAGYGPFQRVFGGAVRVRNQIEEVRARTTLDTPEHRWIAAHIREAVRRLERIRGLEQARPVSDRRQRAVEELDHLSRRLDRLLKGDVFASAGGPPPSGFASMQLYSAPGYREASRACLALSLGLRIEGGPLSLSVKNLAVLYEYWCYLTVVGAVARIVGVEGGAAHLFRVEQRGLQVSLEKGRAHTTSWSLGNGRHARVTYNPIFDGDANLLPQRPDIVIALENPGWPRLYLIVDAKYRLDSSEEYRSRHGIPGPPEDALNVLHRYRDAIVESDLTSHQRRQKRAVVQAVAAYPYRPARVDEFGDSRFAKMLDRIGIGAIPLLPGSVSLLDSWLTKAIRAGGWSLAESGLPVSGQDRALEWRADASEAVLVGVLRGDNPRQHLEWIEGNLAYYTRLHRGKTRQLAARYVAIYSPKELTSPGGVTHVGRVTGYSIVRRGEIATPWPARLPDEPHIRYELEELRALGKQISNVPGRSGRQQRVTTPRWTSLLSLRRAQTLSELLLETEPEWRLLENLGSQGLPVDLVPDQPRIQDPGDPFGRVWFEGSRGRAQYRGSAGFRVEIGLTADYVADPAVVASLI